MDLAQMVQGQNCIDTGYPVIVVLILCRYPTQGSFGVSLSIMSIIDKRATRISCLPASVFWFTRWCTTTTIFIGTTII